MQDGLNIIVRYMYEGQIPNLNASQRAKSAPGDHTAYNVLHPSLSGQVLGRSKFPAKSALKSNCMLHFLPCRQLAGHGPQGSG